MLEAQIRDELAASTLAQLDAQAKRVWLAYGEGSLDEAAATRLVEEIDELRSERRYRPPAIPAAPEIPEIAAAGQERPGAAKRSYPRPTIFPAKVRRQRLRDRKDQRRHSRELAAANGIPPKIAAGFTSGEQAVLFIVGADCWNRGACDRSIDEIAARAGVSASTVKRALRRAEDLELVRIERRPQKGAKHLTNIVRLSSKEWAAWIAKRKPIGVQKRPASGKEDSNRLFERGATSTPAASWTSDGENRNRGELVRLEQWKARG